MVIGMCLGNGWQLGWRGTNQRSQNTLSTGLVVKTIKEQGYAESLKYSLNFYSLTDKYLFATRDYPPAPNDVAAMTTIRAYDIETGDLVDTFPLDTEVRSIYRTNRGDTRLVETADDWELYITVGSPGPTEL